MLAWTVIEVVESMATFVVSLILVVMIATVIVILLLLMIFTYLETLNVFITIHEVICDIHFPPDVHHQTLCSVNTRTDIRVVAYTLRP